LEDLELVGKAERLLTATNLCLNGMIRKVGDGFYVGPTSAIPPPLLLGKKAIDPVLERILSRL